MNFLEFYEKFKHEYKSLFPKLGLKLNEPGAAMDKDLW